MKITFTVALLLGVASFAGAKLSAQAQKKLAMVKAEKNPLPYDDNTNFPGTFYTGPHDTYTATNRLGNLIKGEFFFQNQNWDYVQTTENVGDFADDGFGNSAYIPADFSSLDWFDDFNVHWSAANPINPNTGVFTGSDSDDNRQWTYTYKGSDFAKFWDGNSHYWATNGAGDEVYQRGHPGDDVYDFTFTWASTYSQAGYLYGEKQSWVQHRVGDMGSQRFRYFNNGTIEWNEINAPVAGNTETYTSVEQFTRDAPNQDAWIWDEPNHTWCYYLGESHTWSCVFPGLACLTTKFDNQVCYVKANDEWLFKDNASVRNKFFYYPEWSWGNGSDEWYLWDDMHDMWVWGSPRGGNINHSF